MVGLGGLVLQDVSRHAPLNALILPTAHRARIRHSLETAHQRGEEGEGWQGGGGVLYTKKHRGSRQRPSILCKNTNVLNPGLITIYKECDADTFKLAWFCVRG